MLGGKEVSQSPVFLHAITVCIHLNRSSEQANKNKKNLKEKLPDIYDPKASLIIVV